MMKKKILITQEIPDVAIKILIENNFEVEVLKEHLNKKDQVLFFINRRGFAPYVLCKKCLNVFTCPRCSINLVFHKNKKILSIGDNLNTDIKGANLLNYDSLLISNGIHRNEIKNKGIQDVSKEYEAIVNFIQSDLKW